MLSVWHKADIYRIPIYAPVTEKENKKPAWPLHYTAAQCAGICELSTEPAAMPLWLRGCTVEQLRGGATARRRSSLEVVAVSALRVAGEDVGVG